MKIRVAAENMDADIGRPAVVALLFIVWCWMLARRSVKKGKFARVRTR